MVCCVRCGGIVNRFQTRNRSRSRSLDPNSCGMWECFGGAMVCCVRCRGVSRVLEVRCAACGVERSQTFHARGRS